MYLSRCTTPHQSTIFTFGHKQFQFHLSVTDKKQEFTNREYDVPSGTISMCSLILDQVS